MINISETFIGVQGEGTRAGMTALFLRVAGCNLAEKEENGGMSSPCSWCDSSFSWYKKQGTPVSIEQIEQDVDKICIINRIREICLTGGEPLYTEGIKDLIQWLSKRYELWIETNGSLPIWRDTCHWSMDIKCPSSGNDKYNNYDNLLILSQRDQLKFVITDRVDFDFASHIIKSRVALTNVIFQPAWGQLKLRQLIKWVIEDKELHSIVRVGTQLHKAAFGPRKRGV